jgi:hypothetical protein
MSEYFGGPCAFCKVYDEEVKSWASNMVPMATEWKLLRRKHSSIATARSRVVGIQKRPNPDGSLKELPQQGYGSTYQMLWSQPGRRSGTQPAWNKCKLEENEYGKYVSCTEAGMAQSITEAWRRKLGFPFLWENRLVSIFYNILTGSWTHSDYSKVALLALWPDGMWINTAHGYFYS